jgi:rod shape-determining protein MreD
VSAAVKAVDLMFTHPARFFASPVPFVLVVILVMFANVPVSLTGGMLPSPALALAAIYFWVLVRPDLMPPAAVFAIGLLEDLLSGGPPGLWAAGFLAAYALTDRQREILAGLSGLGAIIAFAGAMLVAATTAYLLALAVYFRLAPLPTLLLESVSTVVFYPMIALVMRWVHRRVVGPMRREE